MLDGTGEFPAKSRSCEYLTCSAAVARARCRSKTIGDNQQFRARRNPESGMQRTALRTCDSSFGGDLVLSCASEARDPATIPG